jgi:hypothetical protein
MTCTGTVFDDVNSETVGEGFCGYIEYFASLGVTGGCSAAPPLYCPNNILDRAQMAVFLLGGAKSLDILPSCSGTVFGDVNKETVGETFCRFIEFLAFLGITGGCGGGNYCPHDPVTREQMAVFLEVLLGAIPYQLPGACSGFLSDVGFTTEHERYVCRIIEVFQSQGISGGCSTNPPLYCPSAPVTRAEMAVFLPVTEIVYEKQTECNTNHICGPAGGEVGKVSRPDSYLPPVRIVVPPGALDQERSFQIEDTFYGYVPSLPWGFIAYPDSLGHPATFGLETGGDLPYDLGLYFYFPVEGMTIGPREIPSAFGYDERTGKWGIVLPDTIDSNTLTVRTNYREKWSWGKIVLDDVETEHLFPALEEKLGKDEWAAIAAKFGEFFDHPEFQQVELTCESLTNYRNIFLESMKQQYRQLLETWKAQFGYRCGICDVFSERFTENCKLWVVGKILDIFVDVLIYSGDLDIRQSLIAVSTLFVYDVMVKALGLCDFDCLFKEGGWPFAFDLVAYYMCIAWQEAIDKAIATRWGTCP